MPRERLENSNYILVRIPIQVHLFERGQQRIGMDPGRLRELLGLSDQGVESLCKARLVRLSIQTVSKKRSNFTPWRA